VKIGIIQTVNEKGFEFCSAASRQHQKVFYKLSMRARQKQLF
jgi:hypothetical protein